MKNLKHFGKRGLSVLLALVLCLSLLPMSAFAATITPDSPVFVGETGSVKSLKTLVASCPYCGGDVDESAAEKFRNVNIADTTCAHFTEWNIGYRPYGGYSSVPCMEVFFQGTRPGTTSSALTYEANYERSYSSGYCKFCGGGVSVPSDFSWYLLRDTVSIPVYARYQLTYNSDGGSHVAPTTQDVPSESATLSVAGAPTKQGYTFKGWKDETGSIVSSVTLYWSEGLGSKNNPVTKTLTAVWEEDNPQQDTTYKTFTKYWIDGDVVATVTSGNKDGKVGDQIVGATLGAAEPTKVRTVDSNRLTFQYDSCDPDILTLGTDATANVITLNYVHNHVDNSGDGKCDECGKNICPHTNVSYNDNQDGRTHDGVCDDCQQTVVDNENHADGNTDGYCDKCGACTHTKGSDGYCTDPNCTHDSNCTCGGKNNGWTCNHEHYSDGSCKTPNCTHAADSHDCCPTHFHADNDDDLKCDICGEPTVCFHPAGQCGDECKHPADCQCKKHVHKDESPADGECDDCGDCLHTPNSCGDECDHDAACQCKHTHKDENPPDGKCDDCGVCLHNKDDQGYCTEENCQHGTDCCVKKPGDHQHKDEEPKDGKCDECGACMHEKDPATGYCTVEGCDHTGCCVKDPGKHQHKDEEPKDGKCDDCGACMHEHEDGYCVDPDCTGTGDHSQCCTKKKAPQVTISNRYAPITVNNGVATAPYTVTVKNESGYPLYSLDIKDKLTTTVYQHGTTTPTDAVEIKVIPVDVTLNGTSIKDKVDLGGERTVSANATTNLQWTVLKGNETFADDAVVTLTYNVTIRLTGNVGVDYRFNNTAKGVTDTEYKPAPEVAMASYQAPVYFEKFETEETNTGAGNIPDSDPDPVTPPSGGDTGTGGTLLPDSGGNQGGNEGGNQGGNEGGNQGGGNDPDDIYIPDDPTPLNPTPVTPPEVEIDDERTPLASANGLNSVDHFAYIAGYTDGTVRPESNITRAEVATIFYRLMTDVYRAANWSDTNDFSDVNAGDWFNNAVSTCAKAGIVSGYSNGTFAPNQAITRAEFATIAARFLDEEITGENAEGFSDIDGHWAKANILRAAEAGWVNGDNGRFRPDNYITRAEVMTIVNRMLNRLADKEHMLDDMKVWPDNPETAWYYEAVQEATNSHQYESLEETHDWTELDEDPDWSALEKEWAAG